MKKLLVGVCLGALALGLLCGCAQKDGGEAVSVMSVSMLTGMGPVGASDTFAGKVVSGETAEIKRDADKTVLEVLVEEGDMVQAGDVLFSYDTEAMQLSLDKLYLERENLENTVSAAESEIAELERQRAKASSDQQLSYTLQIDSRQADIREAQYNTALKDREIAAMEEAMENTEITSPLTGRVMSVGSTDEAEQQMGDASSAFITVMDVSAYRVEGHINELNRGSLTEGMPVLVRSRLDGSLVWTGVLDSIDWEKPVAKTNSGTVYYSDSGDEMTTASKYPFYVTLDTTDGLLLGEHVYIEPDYGQEDEAPGMQLPGWYIVDGSYVWAANGKGRLEKRSVTLGEYDPDTDTYEITSGLDYTDYIAFPEDGLTAGAEVVYYDESSFGGEDFYYDEGMVYDEGMSDGEDAYYDDGGAVFYDEYGGGAENEFPMG